MARTARVRSDIHSRPSGLPLGLFTAKCRKPEQTLQALMGLQRDTADFREYIDTMKACASRHLDCLIPFHLQPKDRFQRYLRSVSKHVPLVTEYEDSWPAIAYGRIWLRGRLYAPSFKSQQKEKHKTGSPLPKARPALKSEDEQGSSEVKQLSPKQKPAPVASPSHKDPQENARSQIMMTTTSHDASQRDRSPSGSESRPDVRALASALSVAQPPAPELSRSATLCLNPSATASSRPQSSTSRAPQPQHQSSRSSAGGSSTETVTDFLLSLTQPLPHLLPVLVTDGIRDAASLRGLASLTDKSDWLYRLVLDHKITALEFKILADGLNKLAEAQ